MEPIRIEIAETIDQFSALQIEWRRLFAVSGGAPFLSWEWLSTWFRWFGGQRTPFILKAFRGDELVGILPAFSEKKRVVGLSMRRLGLIGEGAGGADYLDVIARPKDRAEIVTSIGTFLSRGKAFDLISFESLRGLSELANLSAGPELNCRSRDVSVCPGIDLNEGWASILKNSSRADNFNRRLKKLQKLADFEFRTVTAEDAVGDAYERFFELHEARWRSIGGSEFCGHPRLAAFQRDAVFRMAGAGLVRFEEVWAEGKCRASVYGLESDGVFYYFNAGYDLDWASKSVGLVLTGLSIRSAVERGLRYYDFLRGSENYKYDWSNREVRLVVAELTRPGLQTSAHRMIVSISAGIKELSKRILPDEIADSIKARKRAFGRRRLNAVASGVKQQTI